MRLLLDTHIRLWALLKPDKISSAVQRELGKPKNEFYLAPISIWEAHHLFSRKRLRINGTFIEWLERTLTQIPLREAPFNFAVAAELCSIDLPQADLGDLIIAATALRFIKSHPHNPYTISRWSLRTGNH